MPEPTRQYIFTEGQIRIAFIMSGIGMVSILVLFLVLTTARPQGEYAPSDTSQFENTLQLAIADLEGYEVLENGRATIDIEQAMVIVADRGVSLPLTSIEVASEDVAAGDEPAPAEADGAVAELPDGGEVYAVCAGCHQQNGQGIPGAFPPLAGHAPTLYAAEGGPEFLVNVLLYGLQGEITVNGATYNGLMPAWQQLSNEEIAAVLNHILTSWGNEAELEGFEPYAAADIEEQRGLGLTPSEVLELRAELGLPD